ncbi:hypothetical protein K458DRAFT_402145 [Lentithecium fluviatile CBS 122367]|uniref:Uncharacterized protein n=1 Tax=Lentithecium fluviatile CBS 122367 TaxID=1168545 RepID=A0A6G1J7K0_9PLEO|nr:hypothetical protein K458DRAFT_402145 [Lentithecium fluviatile CBS 122367]
MAINLTQIRVAYDPARSYYACTSNGSWIGNGVPASLLAMLPDTTGKKATKVSLGVGGSRAAVWPSGNCDHSFLGKYERLQGELESPAPGAIETVSLSAFDDWYFFLARRPGKGRLDYTLMGFVADEINSVFDEEPERRSRED